MIIDLSILDNDPLFLSIISESLVPAEVGNYRTTTDTNVFMDGISENPTIGIVDFYLNYGITAVDVLKRVKSSHPLVHFIFISSQPSVPQLMELINIGWGFHFVRKDQSDFIVKLKETIECAKNTLAEKITAAYTRMKIWEEFKADARETLKVIDGHG